jgi:two-component system, cell cycle sensor histidine kinase and response regulator CckA
MRAPLSTPADAAATSGVGTVACKPPRVLVVEDEPQVRALAARALMSAGFEVVQAANGALGLSTLKEPGLAFDVLVTDVVMPELNGPDLAREARQLDQNLGLVFMSGFPEAMHDAQPGDFTGAAFLVKPFAASELVEAVRRCIERRSSAPPEQG